MPPNLFTGKVTAILFGSVSGIILCDSHFIFNTTIGIWNEEPLPKCTWSFKKICLFIFDRFNIFIHRYLSLPKISNGILDISMTFFSYFKYVVVFMYNKLLYLKYYRYIISSNVNLFA